MRVAYNVFVNPPPPPPGKALRFLRGMVRKVPVFGSNGSSEERVCWYIGSVLILLGRLCSGSGCASGKNGSSSSGSSFGSWDILYKDQKYEDPRTVRMLLLRFFSADTGPGKNGSKFGVAMIDQFHPNRYDFSPPLVSLDWST